jgi:NTP pyrophosphatase (non-canonical NTP hydrolase)
MDFQEITQRALSIREQYSEFEKQHYGESWTSEEIALGLVGDIGDLVKLVMAESGHRNIPDSKRKLKHELADCLWSIIVLANNHDIDLEKSFLETMDTLERRLSK